MEEAARATRGRRRSLKEGVIQGVNLEASDRFELRRLAKERRTSVSAVIREAVRLYLWGHAGGRLRNGPPAERVSVPETGRREPETEKV